MSKKEELEISIPHTGEVTINVIGAKGASCIDMTKELEESLGILKSMEKKSEYYQQEDTLNTSIYTGGNING